MPRGPGSIRTAGDFDGNGAVEQGTLDAVLNNWGGDVLPDFCGVAVPEPAVGLMLTGLAVSLRRPRSIVGGCRGAGEDGQRQSESAWRTPLILRGVS